MVCTYGGLLYVRGERGKMNVGESYQMIRRKCLRVHMVCTRLIFVCERRWSIVIVFIMSNYLCFVVFSRAINSNNAASYMSTAPLAYGMPIETKLKYSCVVICIQEVKARYASGSCSFIYSSEEAI